MNKILISRKISIDTRKGYVLLRLVNIALWFRNLAFETWMPRRILKIPRTDHKTNNKVFQVARAAPTLLSTIKKRKCKYFGHLTRENSIQSDYGRESRRTKRQGKAKSKVDG